MKVTIWKKPATGTGGLPRFQTAFYVLSDEKLPEDLSWDLVVSVRVRKIAERNGKYEYWVYIASSYSVTFDAGILSKIQSTVNIIRKATEIAIDVPDKWISLGLAGAGAILVGAFILGYKKGKGKK
jgi:hypothetical protein